MTTNEQDEVRTTVVLTARLHVWLRQYALARRITFARLVMDILLEWAKNHGYPEQPGNSPRP